MVGPDEGVQHSTGRAGLSRNRAPRALASGISSSQALVHRLRRRLRVRETSARAFSSSLGSGCHKKLPLVYFPSTQSGALSKHGTSRLPQQLVPGGVGGCSQADGGPCLVVRSPSPCWDAKARINEVVGHDVLGVQQRPDRVELLHGESSAEMRERTRDRRVGGRRRDVETGCCECIV